MQLWGHDLHVIRALCTCIHTMVPRKLRQIPSNTSPFVTNRSCLHVSNAIFRFLVMCSFQFLHIFELIH